jgi:putative oxidoreductase
MIGLRGLSRTLLAGSFILGGFSAWKRPDLLAVQVEPMTSKAGSQFGTAIQPQQFVKANAALQMVGGVLFALGIFPRALAIVLGASLVPTTIAEHAFWTVDEQFERADQRMKFWKSMGVLGGLISVALDTGGRPSVFWSGRKAAEGLAETIGTTTHKVAETIDIR